MEAIVNKVDESISGAFHRLGSIVANRPKTTLGLSVAIAIACGVGLRTLTTENRPEKLWVPQNTMYEQEDEAFQALFPKTSRFNTVIVKSSSSNKDSNVLTKDVLREAMNMHLAIETGESKYEGVSYNFTQLCTPSGNTCASFSATDPICRCFVLSVLKQWNYDLDTLEEDDDVLATLNAYTPRDGLYALLGNPTFEETSGSLVSADGLRISYFQKDRSIELDGNIEDPINEQWEGDVFLKTLQSEEDYPNLSLYYLSSRSFSDEFGGAITGDLVFVQVSYVLAFVFLGATLGHFRCGPGSRWVMAFAALCLVGLSTVAGFGISSGVFGLFFGPVHSLLPFILLGIGVDDVFVICNAFNRERYNVSRQSEDDEALTKRSAKALSRAGASITVTSMTDLVAFAISSSSALPALASFCAYASICIFFLWAFAATFYTAAMVLDEKRQRDNRRDCLCCITRKTEIVEDEGATEGKLSGYFRTYHAPAILSKPGKAVTLIVFSALLAFGIFGTIKLPVEDSERKFIPKDSYVNDFIAVSDELFPTSNGIGLSIVFEDGMEIYEKREQLANLQQDRITDLNPNKPPYISNDQGYKNVMSSFHTFLSNNGTMLIGNITLGTDNWPLTYDDFVFSLEEYANVRGPGGGFAQDVSFDSADSSKDRLSALRVQLEYVPLMKTSRGETINDADRQIEAMDATRDLIEEWNDSDDLPPVFPYSNKFLSIEGFKIIKAELYRNVGLAIAAVSVIVLLTVGSPVTALMITLNVAFCIIEILGFMYALGIVIDSVSVINIVLAVGLSVDYSAHIGHCFMVKGGSDKDKRATEALADIGASVLNGATSTFLAVSVLLFSSSYVFQTLSVQFALTVLLGVAHGLILLPVMLALFGPKAFSSAEKE